MPPDDDDHIEDWLHGGHSREDADEDSRLNQDGLTRLERASLVLRYFLRGYKVDDVVKTMRERHHVTINRVQVHRDIQFLARRGMIRSVLPLDIDLRQEIHDRYQMLQNVKVVSTAVYEHVAEEGAMQLLRLVQKHRRVPFSKANVRIGFAGGIMMRTVARCFERLLRDQNTFLPGTITMHALVSGFDTNNPTTNPNAFFIYFDPSPAPKVKIEFVGLNAPPIVESRSYADIQKLNGIREAYEAAQEIDILVTSASLWGDPDSRLPRYMRECSATMETLEREGVVGDMLSRPIGPKGPIEVTTPVRAFTLFDLSELQRRIKQGKQVLLVLGSCGVCSEPKTEILRAILACREQLITHLVLDTVTARKLMRGNGGGSSS